MPRQTYVATAVVTVNAAFLQELKEVNQELWRLLKLARCRCNEAGVGQPLSQLIELLLELRDHLALHFALEEAYGYFEDPLTVAPQLSDKAARLRDEHRVIYKDLCEIVDDAEQMLYDREENKLVYWLPTRFEIFDCRLLDHESRENELIMDAYDCDFGGGD